mmetsp:Transcript_19234/g.33103  ORF Transcript_19234/g.33103 Transcript_19234/m.33103 type:complete len:112 (+) Transcript_19234:77-412(+)
MSNDESSEYLKKTRVPTQELYAAGPYLAEACSNANTNFLMCKENNADPMACKQQAIAVQQCSAKFFDSLKSGPCKEPFESMASCLFYANNYDVSKCRNADAAFKECMLGKK